MAILAGPAMCAGDQSMSLRSDGRVGRALSAAMAIALLTACAADTRPATVTAVPVFGERMFAFGYRKLASEYLTPVDLGDLTVSGLRGLSRLDDGVDVTRTTDRLVIKAGPTPVGEFDLPQGNDPQRWAQVTGAAVARLATVSEKVRRADDEAIYKAVFDGVTARLDGSSRYIPRREAEQERGGREGYGGIGVVLTETDGRPSVGEVFPDSPASKAGARTGDIIVTIDGVEAQALAPDQIRDRLRGPIGTVVQVGVARDGRPRTLTITRDLVVVNTVHLAMEGNIAVIRISAFNRNTPERVLTELSEARRRTRGTLQGVVLDLRGNRGGYLQQSVTIADLFIREGQIVSTRGRHPASGQVYNAARDDRLEDLPMVVLVDGNSASSAEILAAALQDSGRAVLVGSNTFGKGSVQIIEEMPNKGELLITWGRIFAPSGYTFHQQGIVPNVCVNRTDMSADAVMADLRAGRLRPPVMLATWRTQAPDDEGALAQVKSTCPHVLQDPAVALSIAMRLIGDRALYQQALGPGHRGSFAAR
jgi:carboxyl-terminal processing protease